MPREFDFNIAVPGANADKAQGPVRFAQALPFQVLLEHVVGGAVSQGFLLGTNLAVGPIVSDIRKIMNVDPVLEDADFPTHLGVVFILRL